jgi:multiple sugar transport system permease protein
MKKKGISYAKWGYIFLIPFFVVYIVFSLYPLLSTFKNSVYDYKIDRGTVQLENSWGSVAGIEESEPKTTVEFCGLDNFKQVFSSDGTLVHSFWNTIIIWLIGFIPQLAISLLLAVWFTDLRLKIKAQGFFKAVIYLPNVIMASAIAFLFYSLFSQGGALYDLVCKITGNTDTIFTSVWGTRGVIGFINFLLWYGNTTILLMAAIMGVDTSLYESAQIDGANSTQIFWKITIPLIKPLMTYVLVTSLIGGLQMYDVPALLTNDEGFPVSKGIASTKTLVMEIQQRKDSDVGLASAICVVIFVVSAVLGFAINYLGRDTTNVKKKKKKTAKRG